MFGNYGNKAFQLTFLIFCSCLICIVSSVTFLRIQLWGLISDGKYFWNLKNCYRIRKLFPLSYHFVHLSCSSWIPKMLPVSLFAKNSHVPQTSLEVLCSLFKGQARLHKLVPDSLGRSKRDAKAKLFSCHIFWAQAHEQTIARLKESKTLYHACGSTVTACVHALTLW